MWYKDKKISMYDYCKNDFKVLLVILVGIAGCYVVKAFCG